ncbi:AI-2E family transporter [Citricoccus sp. SGAir0253]|uniref:AI-2E family transporter n=1 Tax=Citricoccus sp. SGAir0253 TaxID=2567881 RepID=UPI0010CD1A80|nr:AI-2E family transporter [Citricoccus sp. SGAir0253]QCU77202.1 AI-2E family transporter [Citricoccus sp. SGAir0253]
MESAETTGRGAGTEAGPGADVDPRPNRVWPRFLVIVLSLAGLVIALQFVQGLQGIIGPVFLGLNLVIIAYPLQSWLIGRGVHRFVGASITVALVVVVLLVFLGLILWSASELVLALPQYSEQFTDLYDGVIAWIGSFGVTPDMVLEQLSGLNMSTVMSTLTGVLTALLSNLTAIVGLLATVVMAVFFLAMDSVAVERRMALLNTAQYELGRALGAFAQGVRRYWVVTTLFGLIVALLDVVALMAIGVPMIWVWGVLSFLTNYIPNIGFIIGMIPPALLGLVEGGWGAFFGVIVAYSVLNFVIQSIIQPKFTGDAVGVIPTISFLSLLFWAWILGPLGAILALPATLLLKAIMIDADPQSRWINAFIASDLRGMEARSRRASRRLLAEAPAQQSA